MCCYHLKREDIRQITNRNRQRHLSLRHTKRLRDWTICVAQYIPAGATLTGIAVTGDQVVADLDINPAIVTDPALQEVGVCE